MDFLSLIAYIFPAYVANSAPVLFGGGKTKLDAGMRWNDGKRLFGEGKTLRGLLSALILGTATGAVLALALGPVFFGALPFSLKLLASFLLSLGTMTGDLAGSFLKRRMGFADGTAAELLDQLSFLPFAILFAAPFALPSPAGFLFLVLLTYAAHKAANWGAHQLQWKKVPW